MSIPTSLIVVVLVLAWLVVLVPMVARRREAVPEAEMAGGTFRVLQRSGEVSRRRPSFRRRPASGIGDGPEDVAGEQVSSDEDLDEELLDDEYDDDVEEYDDDDSEYPDDEYVSDGYAGPEDDDDGRSGGPMVGSAAASMVESPENQGSSGSHPYQPDHSRSSGSHPYRPAATTRSDRLQAESGPDQNGERDRDSAGYQDHSTRYDDEAVGDDAYSTRFDATPAEHPDDLHLRPIPRRAGRGGYDPDAAEIARRFKYSRRRRVTVVLVLAALLFSVAAVLINPVLWVGTAVFGLLLIGFLGYLRRQVRIETSIRERRLARLRRARQIRPEYDLNRSESSTTGSSFDRRAAQVPVSGYRRGREVVDLDDDDPAFEDLEYYQPLTYRRAAGQ